MSNAIVLWTTLATLSSSGADRSERPASTIRCGAAQKVSADVVVAKRWLNSSLPPHVVKSGDMSSRALNAGLSGAVICDEGSLTLSVRQLTFQMRTWKRGSTRVREVQRFSTVPFAFLGQAESYFCVDGIAGRHSQLQELKM